LLVSADRSLARIPFDVLGVSVDTYVPLGHTWDVAWLCGLFNPASRRPGSQSAGVSALVLADPRPSPEVLRRFAEGTGLPLAIHEAALVARLVPGSMLLTGVEASGPALFGAWENARYLFIAAHVIRDPEIPFISFIPLGTAGSGHGLAESTLDDPEIRRADLSRCELVVLSGCGSGAPFVDLSTDAASLGESFLDAGAHAVVHTAWAVRDDDASRLMESFVRHWRERGLGPVQALNAAKREAAADSTRNIVDPASWGAFSIALNEWPAH
jgi:CHAT domain-containing protein